MNDLRFAFRQLLKNPGFTAVAVLPLALGIGTTSAVFGLIQGVLLTPPPYPKPERIILISPSRRGARPRPGRSDRGSAKGRFAVSTPARASVISPCSSRPRS